MNRDLKILLSEEEKLALLSELKFQNESLKMTIDSIGDSVVTIDNKGKITTINKAAQILSGWEKEDAIGVEFHKIFKLIDGKDRENLDMSFHDLMEKHRSVGISPDTVLVSKSGKEYFVSATISNILDEKNTTIMGVVILLRDITRIKMLEDEVRREKEQAQAANIAKSTFIANMSHEIRTPLNGIEGMIDLTLLTQLTQEQKENLSIAKECSKVLLGVINNILDFSKIEAGKMYAKNTEFKISDLIEMTVKTNIVHAKEKGIEFNSKINLNLSEVFVGDYGKIQQILNNLISNAIKFTRQGSVCLEVEKLSEDIHTALLRFSVIDTGIGISTENIDKLFKSFSQVDGTNTRKYGGTGLGLIISKKLAEIIDGDISLESIKDKGSRFSLTVRIAKFDSIKGKEENVERKEENIEGKEKNLEEIDKYDAQKDSYKGISRKILIVEDNKANQVVISRMCTIINHTVKIADDGKKALEMLNSDTFDVILMDIQMPNMSGVEATKIIRENEKISGEHIPIIALTAYALAGDREKFIKLGMDEYLSKPLTIVELQECINKVIVKGNNEYHDALYYLDINEPNNKLEDQKKTMENMYIEINNYRNLIEQEDYKGCENSSHIIKEYSLIVKSVIMKNASFRAELAARRKDIHGLNEQLKIMGQEYSRLKNQYGQ